MVLAERKTKFRARKLDYSKALLVLRYDQATDLDDYGSPLRTVTQVATGVDKDEEDVILFNLFGNLFLILSKPHRRHI